MITSRKLFQELLIMTSLWLLFTAITYATLFEYYMKFFSSVSLTRRAEECQTSKEMRLILLEINDMMATSLLQNMGDTSNRRNVRRPINGKLLHPQ